MVTNLIKCRNKNSPLLNQWQQCSMHLRGQGFFFGGGEGLWRGLGVVGLFILFFLFPMCSHKVLMVFLRFPMCVD